MGDNGREPWVGYLEGDVIGKEVKAMGKVYQVVIRVKPEGLLGIVKARDRDEYYVVFVGAGTLPSLAAKVRDVINEPGKKWRSDRFPPT